MPLTYLVKCVLINIVNVNTYLSAHLVSQSYVCVGIQWFFHEWLTIIQWFFHDFFHFYKLQELFVEFNDFSMILKQIWISMVFQEVWNPEHATSLRVVARGALHLYQTALQCAVQHPRTWSDYQRIFQVANTLGSKPIRHRSDTKVPDWCRGYPAKRALSAMRKHGG